MTTLPLLLLLLLSGPRFVDPVLDPYAVVSPDGTWRAFIDPSDRFGDGPSTVRIERDGAVHAMAELAFTFHAAAVTNDGYVVGHGRTDWRGKGDVVIGVTGPNGRVVREERIAQTPSQFLHAAENPNVVGLVVDSAGHWFVLRVADPDINRGWESWWRYPVQSEGPREEVIPVHSLPDREHRWLTDARAVPGTPWILTHWVRNAHSPRGFINGAIFALMDSHGRLAWRLDRPQAYHVPGDEEEERRRFNIALDEAILGVGADATFRIWDAEAAAEVTWQLEPDAAEEHRVVRAGWAPFDPARSAPVPDLPDVTLSEHGVVPLRAQQGRPPLHDLCDFAFDAEGRPVALRWEGRGRYTSLLLSATGAVLRETPWDPLPEPLASGSVHVHALRPGQWLLSVRPYHGDPSGQGWFVVDDASGRRRKLEGIDGLIVNGVLPDANAVAPVGDGGLVALGRLHLGGYIGEILFRCDAAGRVRWVVDEQYEDPTRLFSPQDVTVLDDGTVAVLENIHNKVKFYAEDGAHRRTLDLAEAFGRKPNYPSSIHADGGGFLIEDFNGDPPLWRLSGDGTVRARLRPRLQTGESPEVLYRNARPGPDGALWTHDGTALHVLDAGGTVVRTIGTAPDAERLDDPEDCAIDASGRVWILDGRSGAWHGFGGEGRPVATLRFALEDGEPARGGGFLRSRPGGGFLAQRSGDYVRFDAAGRRMGQAPDTKYGLLLELPGERYLQNDPWGALHVLDASGSVVARHERMPGGRFTREVHAAVLTEDGRALLLMHGALVILDAEGRPQEEIALPVALPYGRDLSVQGDYALVSGWPRKALLYSFADGTWRSVVIPQRAENEAWTLGLAAGGTEILAVKHGTWELHRFALSGPGKAQGQR